MEDAVAMGFEGLMSKAEEIRKKAIEEAWEDVGGRKHNRGYERTHKPEVEAEFDDIPGLFAPFTRTPDPESFNAPIEELKAALNKLSTGQGTTDPISTNGRLYPASRALEKISSAADDVYGWSGTAAQDFKTNYLDPFPAVVKNQFTLVAAVKSALEAEQAMWKETRKNIWDIADNTYKKLEHMDDCGKNEWTMTFTVVASICAVAAVPVSGGTSLLLVGTITAIGATAQVVAAADVVKDPPTYGIEGESVRPVINSMREAIKKQIQYVNETETRIQKALSAMNDLVYSAQRDGNADKHYFCIRRPALADSNPGRIRTDMGYTD
jgi:hypothetical protein